jgi:Protein of unknown function (DUF1153)
MNESPPSNVGQVSGPDGRPLTLTDLPSPDTKRWVIRRKAEVVAAVRGGLLSLDEACRRYKLSAQELLFWQFCIDRYGFAGLRTTRIQHYLGRFRIARLSGDGPEHHDQRSDLHPAVEIDCVLVGHADAAR